MEKVKVMSKLLIIVSFLSLFSAASAQQLWGTLKAGPNKVGFRVIKDRDRSRNNRPIIISVWYPSSEALGNSLSFKEYLFTGIINKNFSLPTQFQKDSALKEFKGVLEIPFIMSLPKITDEKFLSVVNTKVRAKSNAAPINRKFPLVLIKSEPESLSVTCEYLASHGFVVVAVHAPYDAVDPPDSLRYYNTTQDLSWVLDHFPQQLREYVDLNKIGALGFAGGVMPSFYLTMKSSRIKGLINIDGNIFQPLALTSRSVDFHPEKMTTPMLHFVTVGTHKNESPAEENTIKPGLLYKVYVKDSRVRHQDFSIFGRIALHGLSMRGDASLLADEIYNSVHIIILDFFDQLLRQNRNEVNFSPASFKGLEFQPH